MLRGLPCVMALLVLSGGACRQKSRLPEAAAPPTAPPSKDLEVRALIKKGRALADKDLPAAVAVLTEAQRLTPKEPDVLSELGLMQYRSRAFEEARSSVETALRESHTPRQTATAAYYLGLIEEADGHLDAAITALEVAMTARPQPKVELRLNRLKGVKSPPPRVLQGPFSDANALCDALRITAMATYPGTELDACCSGENCRFSCQAFAMKTLEQGLPPPMSELRVFMSRLDEPRSDAANEGPAPEQWRGRPRCGIVSAAVRIDTSWYLAPLLAAYSSSDSLDGSAKLEQLTIEPVGPGGSKLAVLELSSQEDYRFGEEEYRTLTFLGVGHSGKPGQIGPIPIMYTENPLKSSTSEPARKTTSFKWKLAPGTLAFSEQNVTEIVGKQQKSTQQAASAQCRLEVP